MLSAEHVSKSFGATRALDDVSFSVAAGEIVALAGENGAGKTTLMRIVAGELAPDRGTVRLDGAAGFVHQHFLLVNELTIAENLALAGPSFAFATRKRLERDAEATIARSGIALAGVGRRVAELSVGEKSKLELIKAIAKQPALLILDEPTSVLTPREADELFRVVRTLAARGTAIVFISHKLPEVIAIAERVVVMRAGRIVAESRGGGMDAMQLADAMVERRAPQAPPPPRAAGDVRLTRQSMTVRGGEIVAIIGVAGNGQAELVESLRASGLDAAFIPEDRTRDGIVAEMSIAENIALASATWSPRAARERAAELIRRFAIRAQSPAQRAGSLSGGNQQKVILARELGREPKLLVAAEPTRGLDIEATRFVHDELRQAAANGAGVLLITSDLDEAFALADAVHVIDRGTLGPRLSPRDAAENAAALLAGIT